MILAGIDEAGYGPLLGPLVVTAVAVEIPDDLGHVDIWKALSSSVCKAPSNRRDARLPVADSKKLYNRKQGITALERTALVMLAAAGRKPRSFRDLLRTISPQTLDELNDYPWYDGFDLQLPRSTTADDIATRANAVRRNLNRESVRLAGVFCEVVPEGHFNRQVRMTRNKATVLMDRALRLVQRVLARCGDSPRIAIDRHGGREYYVEKLMTFFERHTVRIIEESEQRSAYALSRDEREFTVEFATRGEDRHLPVALASIYSKYLRELLMEGVNTYFQTRVEGLAPTAGYYADARRFIASVEETVRSERLDRDMLIRCR